MVSVIIPYFGLASLFTSIKHPVNKKQCTVKIHTSARVKISGPTSTWSINHHRWLKMLQCAVVIGLKAESSISSGLNALKRCYSCIQKEHAKPEGWSFSPQLNSHYGTQTIQLHKRDPTFVHREDHQYSVLQNSVNVEKAENMISVELWRWNDNSLSGFKDFVGLKCE